MGEREISAKSDLYALGCVTYEMLTGEPPFTGPTAQAIVARVMTESPRLITTQRNTVPAEVEEAVLVALAKLPADRWGSAKEFAEALEGGQVLRRSGARSSARPATRPLLRPPALLGALGGAALLAAWGWLGRPKPAAPEVTRLRITMSPGQDLAPVVGQFTALSANGRQIAYVGEAPNGQSQLWVRDLDALDARPLPGTVGAGAPTFSPDGKWLLFVASSKLRKAPVAGGEVTTLADSVNSVSPNSAWLSDGTIVFTGSDFQLRTVRETGGTVARVPNPPSDTLGRMFVRPLPRNNAVLVTGCTDVCNQMTLGVVDLRSGIFRALADAATAWYASTGHLVALRRNGEVIAIPFDLDKLETRGEAVLLFDGVFVLFGILPVLELAPNGTLLYERSGLVGQTSTVVRVTRDGNSSPIDPSWPAAMFGAPALSGDGRSLAVSIMDGPRFDVWIKQLDRGALSRLTTGAGFNYAPKWRPGGSEVSYISSEGSFHLRVRRPDGTGTITHLRLPVGDMVGMPEWTPDGKWVLLWVTHANGSDIVAQSVGSDSVIPFATAQGYDEQSPAVSPEGRWVAYTSTETGRPEVYLRPFPDVARERMQVSRSGGSVPAWSRDGRELFFVSAANELMAVPVTWSARPALGEPRALFPLGPSLITNSNYERTFEPEPGGKSFIMLKQADSKAALQMVLVLNWFEELKAKLGGAR
jgi:serine/threonine-protein kinase